MDDLKFYTKLRDIRKQYGPIEAWDQLLRVTEETSISDDEVRKLESLSDELNVYELGSTIDFIYSSDIQISLKSIEALKYLMPFNPLSPTWRGTVGSEQHGPLKFAERISRSEEYVRKEITFSDNDEYLISVIVNKNNNKRLFSTLRLLDSYLITKGRLNSGNPHREHTNSVGDGLNELRSRIKTLGEVNEEIRSVNRPEGYKYVFGYLSFISSLCINRYDNFDEVQGIALGHEEQEMTVLSMSSGSRQCNPNGCTTVPSWISQSINAVTCCNDHDILYCKGGSNKNGSEYGRWKSDNIFYKCLNKNSNSTVANKFYSAVRHYGANHFNYFSSPWSSSLGNTGNGGDIKVSIVVEDVEYFGGDIGDDTSIYGIFRMGNSATTGKLGSGAIELVRGLSNESSRNINKNVFDETIPEGESIYGFSIFGGAIERDVFDSETNYWVQYSYYGDGEEKLQPGYKWGDSISILMSEGAWGTAVFRFLFSVEISRVRTA